METVEYATLLNWEVLASRSLYVKALVQDVGGQPDCLEVPDYFPRDVLDEVMEVLGDPAHDKEVARSLASLVVSQRDAIRYVHLFTYLATDKIFQKMLEIVVAEMPRQAHDLLAGMINFFSHKSPWATFIFKLLSKFTKKSPQAILGRITDRSGVIVKRSALKRFFRDSLRGAAYTQEKLTLTCHICEKILEVRIKIDQNLFHYETRMLCCAALAHKQCFWQAVREGWCHFCGTALRADGSFNNLRMSMERIGQLADLWLENGVELSHSLIPPELL